MHDTFKPSKMWDPSSRQADLHEMDPFGAAPRWVGVVAAHNVH